MFTKAICRDIYLKYNILLDVNYVLSRGKYRISDEYYNLVFNTADILDEFNDILHVEDIPTNPTGIWHQMIKYADNNGSGIENYQFKEDYIPKDNNLYTLIVIDHISLLQKERGFNTKEVIDKLSEYLLILRNKCQFTPIVVQQLNRSNSSIDRFKMDRLEPQISDFKDSGNPVADANIVMSLFSPFRYELKEHKKYDISKLKNNYRQCSILKNRDGESDKSIGLHFIGEVGLFNELPRVEQMTDEIYMKYQSIKKSFKVEEN